MYEVNLKVTRLTLCDLRLTWVDLGQVPKLVVNEHIRFYSSYPSGITYIYILWQINIIHT